MTDSRRSGSRSLDLLMVALLAVLVVGGHILVWADDPDRGLITGNQLFSIWALPVYAGFLPAAYVMFLWWSGRRRGGGVPLGYRAALAGAAIFLVGLAAEFSWRSVAGRPASAAEALLSPSRIVLFVGGALMISGPLLSIASRISASGSTRRIGSVDAIAFAVSVALLMATATLLTRVAHPFVVLAGAPIEQPAPPPTDLYRVPLDGSGSERLTVTPGEWETHPDVAPDGSSVAFDRGSRDDQRVFSAALDGTGATRLTDRTTNEESPVWAPDGTRLAVWAPLPKPQPSVTPAPVPGRGPGSSPQQVAVDFSGLAIWIIAPGDGAGTPLHQVTGEGAESWSPDGTRLCGWVLADGHFNVAVWEVATGQMTQVTSGPGDAWSCDWSPDGTRLLFHSDRDGNWEIYSSAPDGSFLRRLTSDPGVDQLPRWSPDGSQLAWMSGRGGDLDIWVAEATGASPRNITNDPALDDGIFGLSWLPDGSGLIAASDGRSASALTTAETVPLGIGAIALNALIVVGTLLFALRVIGPLVGVGTIAGLIGGLLAALAGAEPLLFASVVAAGLAADVVHWRSTSGGRRTAVNLAGATAFVLVSAYFVVLAATRGVAWDMDLVLGSVALATVLAIALAFLVSWPDRPVHPVERGATIS